MQKSLPKGNRWSRTIMLREMEANWILIIRLAEMRPSNNQMWWYRVKRCGGQWNSYYQPKEGNSCCHFSNTKTKDLIQENPYSHGMRKKVTGMPRVVWIGYLYKSIFNYIQISMQKWIIMSALDPQVQVWFPLEVYPFFYLTLQKECYVQHDNSQYFWNKKK